ncbi:hypothetical protein BV924_18045 [Pectobacterium odoriferum]|uniref:Uncharacterized protein n=1 Tax=Pectobacterium odoriferum TaxID=78398 RepID=A0ABD6VN38_9GAMM|nr:hypothetical protein [Pectobacterium odoriferum]POD93106.1 hypothetical protein BVY06_18400 [Pectobacterium odoriferum]POE10006.1 hypothetical protein BV924_18045 [Pectobacterium odoriferum]POE24736.1 hypothetical protein BV926_18095 [Pectobacterium odoriferum]POE29465.1 hypothetical protein BV919_18115 [Pectobacterium odoriferum]POE38077.1 hypothetical protein BV920_18450 [Pectobacterium odoriferum]
MAILLAANALSSNNIKYMPGSLDAVYMTKHRFSDGHRKGWVVSARLNVPEGFEPNMVFVEVSDPSGEVYMPPIF